MFFFVIQAFLFFLNLSNPTYHKLPKEETRKANTEPDKWKLPLA